MNNDRKIYNLQIAYVILLSAFSPLLYLWVLFAGKVFELAEDYANGFTLLIIFLPVAVYWIIVLILGIRNVIKSFATYKKDGAQACVKGMLILKYGLVIFFCINFLLLFVFYFLATVGTIMGTRGMAILFAPVLLPWLVVAVSWSVFSTWLAILPGSFFSIQVIRASYREKKIGIGGAILHTVLQFVFLTDVLDAMYLAAKKWNMGKKSSIAVGIVYVLGVIGTIWLICTLMK